MPNAKPQPKSAPVVIATTTMNKLARGHRPGKVILPVVAAPVPAPKPYVAPQPIIAQVVEPTLAESIAELNRAAMVTPEYALEVKEAVAEPAIVPEPVARTVVEPVTVIEQPVVQEVVATEPAIVEQPVQVPAIVPEPVALPVTKQATKAPSKRKPRGKSAAAPVEPVADKKDDMTVIEFQARGSLDDDYSPEADDATIAAIANAVVIRGPAIEPVAEVAPEPATVSTAISAADLAGIRLEMSNAIVAAAMAE